MNDTFRITMLGASSSGKTCYLTAMYGMMQVGYNGFTLRADDHNRGVDLNNLWEQLILETGPKRFPPATADVPTSYRFKFCYALEPVMDFEWLDYRGGALRETSTGASVKELQQHLHSSACTFVTVPADFLAEPLSAANRHVIAAKSGVNRIVDHLTRLRETVRPTADRPIPVVIVITKFDLLVTPGGKAVRPNDAITDDMRTLFQALFAPNSGFLVMLCKVSLGPELGQNAQTGAINPQKVHLPIVFATFRYLNELLVTLKEEEAVTAPAAGRKRGFFEKVVRFFTVDDESPEEAAERLAFIRENIAGIRQNLVLLSRELENEHIFLSGVPWTVA